MKRGSGAKVCALIVVAVAGMLLAPGCDVLGLGTCDTSGGGGAGGSGDVGGGGGDYPAAGCTPTRTCDDMYEACREKRKYPCNKNMGGMTLCAACLDDCNHKRPYKFSECYTCGFDDL
jgi:hypothetical protein